jgi:hypothetical protein
MNVTTCPTHGLFVKDGCSACSAMEYEAVRSYGDKRFASECAHANVSNGTCKDCCRKVA